MTFQNVIENPEDAAASPERPEPEGFVRTEGAARILDHSPVTLRRWRMKGDGPPYIRTGRIVLYDPAALRRWAREHTFNSTSEEKAA